jgi:hypothetical protein
MAHRVRRVDYFYSTVRNQESEAYQLLSQLASLGVSLLAFNALPMGPMHAQLTLFPEDDTDMAGAAEKAGLVLEGPHPALLVQGDDELGALAGIHEKLFEAKVSVFSSSGVADDKGGYGYVLYIRPSDFERAARALGL